MASFAQGREQAARRSIAEQHMPCGIEHDHRVRQRIGHQMHGRSRARNSGGPVKRAGKRLIAVMAGQQHHGRDETDEADQGEGLGETGDQHQRRHDDADGDDQPQGCLEPRPDLAEGPHDGIAGPDQEARLKRPRARFCLVAQWLLPALRTNREAARHYDCPCINTLLRQA